MFQLRLDLGCDSRKEFLITTADYINQMRNSIGLINKLKPDVVVFPEMSYSSDFEEAMREISKSALVVYGSEYISDNNTTIIFQGERKSEVIKRYPSGAEPMARKYRGLSVTDFISNYLNEHTFTVKGQKIVILNCLEYYHVAYFIARDPKLQDVFGFVVPCSNSNTTVFLQETMALHNHNENIYSFVCNTNSVYNGEGYGDGNSYIFGPVHMHEKQWLKQDNIPCFEHMCSIARLNEPSSCLYGEFALPEQISRFGRSDFYHTTPQNVTIFKLL
jgi:predicted amidohydrolase